MYALQLETPHSMALYHHTNILPLNCLNVTRRRSINTDGFCQCIQNGFTFFFRLEN